MNKAFFFLLAFCLIFFPIQLFSQDEILLQGKLTSCEEDSIKIFVLDGASLRLASIVPLAEQADAKVFNARLANVQEGFYFVGFGQQKNTRGLILGKEPQVYMQGTCPDFAKAQIANSAINLKLQQATQKQQAWRKQVDALNKEYAVAFRAKRDINEIVGKMAKIDQAKLTHLENLKESDPFIAKVVALSTLPAFYSSGRDFANQIEYIGEKYFQYVDLKDQTYNRIPHFQDAFRSFSYNLSVGGIPNMMQLAYVDKVLEQIPQPSTAHKSALLGLTNGFQRYNEDGYAKYALAYLDMYPADNIAVANSFRTNVQRMKHRLVGQTAPELSLPTPEGDTLNITDLRGKYVLLDFWASWCGPCRRENPNVRKVYAAYEDKGFEILGLSLDRSESAWLAAIEKDQLPWKHMSDLKQWRSVASKTYGVGSIPFTVLLDPDGKILNKNIRGAYLKQELEKLLGSE